MNKLILSNLGHTWILDLDGTIVKHNSYRVHGRDSFLPGAKEFLEKLPTGDMLVFITSRADVHREMTEKFLKENGIRYDHIIFNAPYGERILINDRKPDGLETCIAIARGRDDFVDIEIIISDSL